MRTLLLILLFVPWLVIWYLSGAVCVLFLILCLPWKAWLVWTSPVDQEKNLPEWAWKFSDWLVALPSRIHAWAAGHRKA